MKISYVSLQTLDQAREVEELNTVHLRRKRDSTSAGVQGILGTVYSADLVMRMAQHCAPVLAVVQGKVIGFALLLDPDSYLQEHEELITSMKDRVFKDRPLSAWRYVRCLHAFVQKGHRRKQVLKGMYAFVTSNYPKFNLLVTRLNQANTSSRVAHQRIGFIQFETEPGPITFLHVAKELQRPRL